MLCMSRDEKAVAGSELNNLLLFKFQGGIAMSQQHPLRPGLIIPKSLFRGLAMGNNTFQANIRSFDQWKNLLPNFTFWTGVEDI